MRKTTSYCDECGKEFNHLGLYYEIGAKSDGGIVFFANHAVNVEVCSASCGIAYLQKLLIDKEKL